MNAPDLLERLGELGVELEDDGGRLRYRAPNGVLSDGLRSAMADNRDHLLALVRDKAPAPAAGTALSSSQQRLWFLERLMPENRAYTIGARARLRGAVDVVALGRSLDEIVRRHHALRTGVREVEGEPQGFVTDPGPVPLQVVHLAGMSEAEAAEESERREDEELRRPFKLDRPPLLRALVFLGDDWSTLLLSTHHLAADGWSMGIVVDELSALYRAFNQGHPTPLPELPVQYPAVAAAERARLASGELEPQLAYWRQQLAGAEPTLDLPTDRPRPPVPSGRGALVRFDLPSALVGALRTLSRQERVTPFMTLLAGLQVLLHRYTEHDDFVVGTAVSVRRGRDTEGLVGPFGNNLPLRADCSGQPSFRELLRRVRTVVLGALAHQDLPFEALVDDLAPPRDLSRSPLFQVMLVLHRSAGELELSGLRATLEQPDQGTAKFDLELSMFDRPDGLTGALEYSTDLFDGSTAERLVGHFCSLLAGLVADPDAEISRVDYLMVAEHQELAQWNATEVDYRAQEGLHRLFEAQVVRAPERVAVIAGDETLTYRQLDGRANKLAHYLRKRGVGPDVVVGVALERGTDMVVALLAVLKAGGAYLPLDPGHPPQRLSFIVSDAGAPLVLTHAALRPSLAGDTVSSIALDADWHQIDDEPEHDLEGGATLDDVAYVIYTSGSTGQPKGVMVNHRGIVNRILWMDAQYGMTADDAVLQKTPFTFDVSVWEFFWPLLTGARLVMARPDGHRDPVYLSSVIAEQRITTLHFVPSMLQVFLEEADVAGCTSVRRVFCSGEALPAEVVSRFFQRLGAELHNLYGPTEASVDVTYWPCHPGATRVPIGRPIANTQIWVLDRHLQPVPVGVAGELYIGGLGLARGYLNRPELTEARFVPDPFHPGGRLYKTGDRARYLPGGDVEFLGRLDNQVKIRGFRIELDEVADALRRHPQVRDAVAVVRETTPGVPRLVAYVVVAPGHDHDRRDRHELRRFAQQWLPDYMVPAVIVALPALPLTPSGKVDAQALPALDVAQVPAEAAVEPAGDRERTLAAIWADVLSVDRVGATDNFFELGGDSILSIRIVARAGRAGLRITPRQMFQQPTVRQLATVAERSDPAPAGRDDHADGERGDQLRRWFVVRGLIAPDFPMPGLTAADLDHMAARFPDLEDIYPTTPMQQGMLERPTQPGVYVSHVVLPLQGELRTAVLEASWQDVVDAHPILRTSFAPAASGNFFQVVRRCARVPFEVVDLSGRARGDQEAELAERVRRLRARGFDHSIAPQLRLLVVRFGAREHRVVLAFSLRLLEGWSLARVLPAALAAYEARCRGEVTPTSSCRPHRDYVAWLARQDASAGKSFWTGWLDGFTPVPLAREREAGPTGGDPYGKEQLSLPPPLTERLVALAGRRRLTVGTLVMGAWAMVVAAAAERDDVVFGAVVSGRAGFGDGLDDVIGTCSNILPVRARLRPDIPVLEWLAQLQDRMLDMRQHEVTPLGAIGSWCGLPADELAFQSYVVVENFPIDPSFWTHMSNWNVQDMQSLVQTEHPLRLEAFPGSSLELALSGYWRFFEPADLRRLLDGVATVLESIAGDPDARLGSILARVAR